MNKRNVADIYGLSTMQEGMLFHSLKSESTSMYLEQFSCTLNGQINFEYFWNAWQAVIDHNSVLRTAFVWEGVKKPVQVVLKECEVKYIQYDWSNLPQAEIERDYSKFLENDRIMGFELDQAPLMRFALIQIAESGYYFVWSFHHIVMDGWSLPLVLGQMLENYKALKDGQAPAKKKTRPFKEYINWLNRQDTEISKQYWQEKLQGFEEVLSLSAEPVEDQQGETRKRSLRLSEETYNQIERTAKSKGITSYQIYNLAYAILLGKYSGKEDVVYGTTVSGRPLELQGMDETVGIFINTVPVRVQLDGKLTLLECLENLKQAQISRSPHEYMSLAEISTANNMSHLFQSIFVYENYANAEAYKNITEFTITDLQLKEEINYPLAWVVKPDHGISIETIYNSACFSDNLIEQFLNSFLTILDEIVHKMDQSVSSVQLVPAEQSADLAAGKAVASVVNMEHQYAIEVPQAEFERVLVVDKYGNLLPDGFEGRVRAADQAGSDTGYIGRYDADGTLRINETLSTSMMIGGIKRDVSVLERVLKSAGLAEDIKILQRYNLEGASRLVVYYVEPATGLPGGQTPTEDEHRSGEIRKAIADSLCALLELSKEECAGAAEFVNVSAIPYYGNGAAKIKDLLELEIINDNLISRWSRLFAGDVKFGRRMAKISRDKVHISELADNFTFIKKRNSGKTDKAEKVNTGRAESSGEGELSLIAGDELVIPEDTVFDLGYYIKRAAESAPEYHGIRFINYDGSIDFSPYRKVYSEAKAICWGLMERGLKPGDKVIFQMDNNRNYVNTFWACMLGGFIGIPVTVAASYKEDNAAIRKLLNAWKMLEQPVIMADEALAESIELIPGVLGEEAELTVYIAEQLMDSRERKITYEVKPDDIALLLLTSGSTGMPKGVMQSHRNILRRTIAACQNNGFGPEEITFNWMPMDHVGGIVMCNVRDVYLHCQEILAPVNYILESPLRWLTLMSEYKITNTWAPNFAFNLINSHEHGIKELQLDLSRLRFITNGGEVVVARTALKFNELLKPYKLNKSAMMPCFGMSETCSGSIYSSDFGLDLVRQEDSNVSVGRPLPGHSVRIVDAQNELVPLYTEGRFQMTGVSITPGYYNNPKANAEAFTPDGWFDTGDLGIITDRGLTITGRAKDIIIINGVNYNNSEIEAILEEIDGVEVSYTAAVTVKASASQEEELAVFFHPASMDTQKLKEIIKEMQKVITSKIGIVIEYIVPLAKKDIPKTGIGKIQRILLRDSLLAGKYDAVLKKLELIRNKNTVKPWVFKKVWKPLSFKTEAAKSSDAGFLIFEDGGGLAREFIKGLGAAANRVLSVKKEDGFKVYDRNRIGCDYTSDEGCKELYGYLSQTGWRVSHIVYLPTYGTNGVGHQELASSSQLGVYGLLHVIRMLADHNLCDSTNLYVGSTNVFQGVSGRETHYNNASLIGFMATLGTENTGLRCMLIDLEGTDLKQDAGFLRDEMLHGETDATEISYRDGRRMTWKLKNVPLKKEEPATKIKQGGHYVVTGGLGGIGTRICSLLLENYQANLVILGRSDIHQLDEGDAKVQNYKKLLELEPSIHYRQADICDLESLTRVIEEYEALKGLEIDGIIHLAGNSSYQKHFDHREAYFIAAADKQAFEEEYNAKVYGTLNLFEILQSKKAASMIAFSSVTSLLGSATFSAYAAGNSFLEMFCQYAAGLLGYAVKCISWTMWDKIGMTAGSLQSINSLSESIGQHVIGEKDGLLFFEALLNINEAVVYVGIDENNDHISHKIDEKAYSKEVLAVYVKEDAAQPFHFENAKVIDDFGAVSTIKVYAVNADGEAVEDEESEQYVEAVTATEKTINTIWSEVLGEPRIGMNDNFFELGGHSLKATQVVSRIKKEFAIDFAINDLFYHPTIGGIALLVDERMTVLTDHQEASAIGKLTEEEKQRGIPVSYAQQRLWFLKQYDEESAFYNILEVIKLEGELNVSCLQQAVTEIVKRHDGLRTTFANRDGQIMQVLHEIDAVEIPLHNLTDVAQVAREQVISGLAHEEVNKPFDFEHGPLIRCQLLQFAADEHVIFLTMHHIISDGWSMGIFVREFVELYDALVNQKTAKLPGIEWQYADYTKWQRGWFTGEVKQEQFTYWKNKLKDITTLDIPSDYDRPKVQTFNGQKEFFTYNRSLMDRVNDLAETTGATPFMIYLAAVDVLFARYTGQDDIAIGTPIANRTRKETENTIGFFVNTLVLRNDLSGDISFMELIERVKTGALESYDAQDMPFEMLVDELDIERDLSRNPLFQVMFALQNGELPEFKLPNLKIARLESDNKSAMFDFWISMRELDDGVHVLCEYNTDIYKQQTVLRMMKHLENIINSLCADPYQKIKPFNFMEKDEINEIVYEKNATDYKFAQDLFIHECFEAQAHLRPDAEALRFEGVSLTYREFNSRVNQVAHYLIAQGIGTEDFVGVYADRSIEMMVAVYGILKAGAAYVPIDPAYPRDRVDYMLADSEVKLVLYCVDEIDALDGIQTVDLRNQELFMSMSEADPGVKVEENHAAYMIYTSGSTGKPKGTINVHSGIRNRILWGQEQYKMQPEDRQVQKTPFCFDVSCSEIFWAPTVGACLVIAKPEGHKDVEYLIDLIHEERITISHFVPSILKLFLDHPGVMQAASLRQVFCSGEALPYRLKEQFIHTFDAGLYNLYGPTEASVEVSFYDCREKLDKEIVPIGKPIANVQLYVLDPFMNPVPYNVSGELYIAGVNLARGYYKRGDLTAEKFIANPFSRYVAARMYKTGDIVKLLPDGNINFIGRADNQVKVRGLRIELGEIEKVIQSHPSVKDNVVLAKEDGDDVRIVSYIVRDENYQIHDVLEESKEQVTQWESIFDNAYNKEETIEDFSLNTISWNSSYTGDKIGPLEMEEWLADSVDLIKSLKPRKVLEVGCGTGMILFKIAPVAEEYVGIDLSRIGLDYIERNLNDSMNVRLYQKSADDLGELQNETFDTIIINSVIQYFPSGEYLHEVVTNLLGMLSKEGTLFIGDVRSLPLIRSYHTSVELYKAPGELTIPELKERVRNSIAAENELLVDSKYFLSLKDNAEQVRNVSILPKRTRFDNEMSKFRYQVVIGTKEAKALDNVVQYSWRNIQTVQNLEGILHDAEDDVILINEMTLDKLVNENRAEQLLNDNSLQAATVGELKEQLNDLQMDAPNLYEWITAYDSGNYRIRPVWNGHSESGEYQLLLFHKSRFGPDTAAYDYAVPNFIRYSADKRVYFTNPLEWKNNHEYIPLIREYSKRLLQDYMIPSFFMVLPEMPLLPNGKLNMKELPEPGNTRRSVLNEFVAAANDKEEKVKKIWETVLNAQNIGVNDNFFDIGGHSLLVVQVYYKLKENFATNLTVVDMFKYPTIRSLCDYLEETTDSFAEVASASELMHSGKEAMKEKRKRLKELMRK